MQVDPNYTISELGNSMDGDESKPKGPRRSKIWSVLSSQYRFRFNTIKEKPEYKKLIISETESSGFDGYLNVANGSVSSKFKPVDKFFINSLVNELEKSKLQVSAETVKSILESDFVDRVNPIHEYFKDLYENANGRIYDEINEPDYIREVCNSIETVDPDPNIFYEYFKKWIVGVVANALDDEKCLNHVCLVLTGEQGAYKTTWLNNLCPPKLRTHYLYCGKIDPNNKDTQTLLAEYFLVNIDDQLRQLNRKDENDLKELITKPRVAYRRPYSAYIQEYPHIASFMASVNGNDFLTDPTGNRRFLPFEIKTGSIQVNSLDKLNIDGMYRQAMYLLKGKFQYWIDQKELEQLHERNTKFQVSSVEEELVYKYFEVPTDEEIILKKDRFMLKAEIEAYVGEFNKTIRLNNRRIGDALAKHGFKRIQRRREGGNPMWGYLVIIKPVENIQ